MAHQSIKHNIELLISFLNNTNTHSNLNVKRTTRGRCKINHGCHIPAERS